MQGFWKKSDNLTGYLTIENTGHLPNGLTTETIKLPHHSYPQNPIIADALYMTAFIDTSLDTSLDTNNNLKHIELV